MARTRRIKAQAKRADAKAVRESAGLVTGKVVRIAYHSASKNEITERVIEFIAVRVNKKGERYIHALDIAKGSTRNFTPARIGWMVAA